VVQCRVEPAIFSIEGMIPPSALPSLLWNVFWGLEREYANEGAGTALLPPLDMWANLLRVVNQTGIDRRALSTCLRLSKRAVRSRLSMAVRHAWVEELKIGPGQAIVRLTLRGSDAAARWKTAQSTAEERWQASVGICSSDKLRASLENLVAAFPLEHPHCPASYGPADATVTGGNGKDWKEVLRADGDTVSDLSLSALVSEAIVDFAMRYEEISPVALSLGTGVIRRIPAEGLPLRELGRSASVSALIRHGYLRVGGDGGRIIYLTHRGVDVQRAHEERIHWVEKGWCDAFGNGRVTELRRALEDLARPTGRTMSDLSDS
jgi:hypothetical protein